MYYYHINHQTNSYKEENQKLDVEIRKIYDESKGRYGSPKITKALENKGIKVGLNVSTRIKSSCLNNLTAKEQKEFGRILGVLLDNAIEASTASTTKKIGIEFYSNSSKEVKMLITNTYGNNIDKDKIGKERFSTKGKNRGHGLLLIKQIINNNPIYEMKTEITNELYTQIINVKKV